MDIAVLLESHRKHMLELFDSDELNESYTAIAHAHDRATAKSLLEQYRSDANGEVKPLGQAALTTPLPVATTPSRRVKAGSKKARDRAIKAGETRRKNLAARQREEIEKDSGAGDSPAAVGGAA